MAYRLFIDDVRTVSDVYKTPAMEAALPEGEWQLAVSSEEAIALLERLGSPSFISFDHDLGGDDTAMRVAKFIVEKDLDEAGAWLHADFSFAVHSANPEGTKNLRSLMDSYLTHRPRPKA